MQKMRRYLWLVALTPLLSISVSLPGAGAAETFEILAKPHVGDRIAFDSSSLMNQKVQVTQNGQLARTVEANITQQRKGEMRILSVEEGLVREVKVTFDPDCHNSGMPDADAGDQPFALAGRTVTIGRTKEGKITTDLASPPDQRTMDELSRFVQPDQSVYPTKSVRIGEEWSANAVDIARQYRLGPDDEQAITCKLVAVREVEGRRVAEVSLGGTVVKLEQGFVRSRLAIGGTVQLDLQTGQPVRSDVNVKIDVSGERQNDRPEGSAVHTVVSGAGAMEAHLLLKRVVDLPPATEPVAPADIFEGKFEGDGLSVTLLKGTGKGYSGELVLKGKSMPLVASVDGQKMTGTFESDGTKFRFIAIRQGSSLRLSSDGSSFALERKDSGPAATRPPAVDRPVPAGPG